MVVWESFVSSIFKVLIDRLATREFVDFIQGKEPAIYDQLKKLKVLMLSINAVVNDAEEKQLRDPAIKEWLDELKEAINDAEDVVDDINYESLERKVTDDIADFFKGTKRQIERILERLEFTVKQNDRLGLREGVQASPSKGSLPTHNLVDKSAVFGRDEDIKAILDFLITRPDDDKDGKEDKAILESPTDDDKGGKDEKSAVPKGFISDRDDDKERKDEKTILELPKDDDNDKRHENGILRSLTPSPDEDKDEKDKNGILKLPTSCPDDDKEKKDKKAILERSGDEKDGKDVKAILESPISSLAGDSQSVVSIVGLGGIGKTTLAQIVYDDEEVKNHFAIRAWINLSDEFDVFKMTEAILKAADPDKKHDIKDLYELQLRLRLALKGKKFLFVLDDVWNENYTYWNVLKGAFISGAPGSKIIVTTRSQRVASMMSNDSLHHLTELSDGDALQLFAKHAFDRNDFAEYPKLKRIGENVVGKCNGLPLALKSLGGLLRFELNVEKWKKVLNSNIWELSAKEHNILPALWLSYCDLPSHLKRCFAFCSIFPKFPKDNPLKKEQLILLWMAEDFLQPERGRRIEDVGEEYVQALISRSLLQESSEDPLYITMHDLVHDLATFVSGEFCRRLDHGDGSSVIVRKTRHLSFMDEEMFFEQKDIMKFPKSVRTVLLFKGEEMEKNTQDSSNTDFKQTAKYLRAISLPSGRFKKLPDNISILKHLRYFDFSHTQIQKIPDEINTLCSLQTLILENCLELTELSDKIGDLKHLRYLSLSYCNKLEQLPSRVCELSNLQTLLLEHCSELSGLPDQIGNLKQLRYLNLSSTNFKVLPDTLCDIYNLRTLLLSNCSLTQLPTRMGNIKSLRHLDIGFKNQIKEMPPEMCRMKDLETLTSFVLGKCTETGKRVGSAVTDLRALQLTGSLKIAGLQNAVNDADVSKDDLKDKKYLSKLLLEWKDESPESKRDQEVLEMLEPHKNLKELSIQFFNSTRFPDWIGDHSFSKIIIVHLIDCAHCSSLPPLGQLPSLKQLFITGFSKLKKVGSEFYSKGHLIKRPFPSLVTLIFDKLEEWEEWEFSWDGKEEIRFGDCFKEFQLINCPKLDVCSLPNWLSQLRN